MGGATTNVVVAAGREDAGAKDRITWLPKSLKAPLQDHLQKAKAIHERDLAEDWGRVQMPSALDRKCPHAPAAWRWQWVFPQENRWINPQTRDQGRRHTDESLVQKAVRDAVAKAGLTQRATCDTFPHSFAAYLLQGGYDIRTVQELLGHSDVKTTLAGAGIPSRTHVPASANGYRKGFRYQRSSTVDRRASAVRLTGFEAIAEVIMPIRTRRRDKPLDRAQPTEDKGISETLAAVPTACYTDRKTKPRILCGSI